MQTIYLARGKWWGVLKNIFIQGHVYSVISNRGVVEVIWGWGWRLCDFRESWGADQSLESCNHLHQYPKTAERFKSRVWCCVDQGVELSAGVVQQGELRRYTLTHYQHQQSSLLYWSVNRFLQNNPQSRAQVQHPRFIFHSHHNETQRNLFKVNKTMFTLNFFFFVMH